MATTITWDGGSLVLDASPSQSHSREAEVTDHAVETGGVVTDHVRQRPRSLKLDGVSLAADAYSTLNRLMDLATLVTVSTSLETYDSMVLVGLAVPRDATTGDALRFSATFRRIVFADSQRVTIRLPTPGARVNRGKQATTPTSAETQRKGKAKAKKYRTTVKKLGSGLSDLLGIEG